MITVRLTEEELHTLIQYMRAVHELDGDLVHDDERELLKKLKAIRGEHDSLWVKP